jgi:hypothetical protein
MWPWHRRLRLRLDTDRNLAPKASLTLVRLAACLTFSSSSQMFCHGVCNLLNPITMPCMVLRQ